MTDEPSAKPVLAVRSNAPQRSGRSARRMCAGWTRARHCKGGRGGSIGAGSGSGPGLGGGSPGKGEGKGSGMGDGGSVGGMGCCEGTALHSLGVAGEATTPDG
jgi:hypothetical protein